METDERQPAGMVAPTEGGQSVDSEIRPLVRIGDAYEHEVGPTVVVGSFRRDGGRQRHHRGIDDAYSLGRHAQYLHDIQSRRLRNRDDQARLPNTAQVEPVRDAPMRPYAAHHGRVSQWDEVVDSRDRASCRQGRKRTVRISLMPDQGARPSDCQPVEEGGSQPAEVLRADRRPTGSPRSRRGPGRVIRSTDQNAQLLGAPVELLSGKRLEQTGNVPADPANPMTGRERSRIDADGRSAGLGGLARPEARFHGIKRSRLAGRPLASPPARAVRRGTYL